MQANFPEVFQSLENEVTRYTFKQVLAICSDAIAAGHGSLVQDFLKKHGTKFHPIFFGHIFCKIVQNRNADSFSFMMDNYFDRVPKFYLGSGISEVVKNQDEAIFQIFFERIQKASHRINALAIGMAFAAAVKYQNDAAFTYLFQHFKDVVPEIYMGRAWINAAEVRNEKAFFQIFEQMKNRLSDFQLGAMLQKAAEVNFEGAYQLILEQESHHLSDRSLAKALYGFAKNNLRYTEWMLQHFGERLDAGVLIGAMERTEQEDIFKFLIKQNKVHMKKNQLLNLLLNAVVEDKKGHVDYLMETHQEILQQEDLTLLRNIAKNRNQPMTLDILERGCFADRIKRELRRIEGILKSKASTALRQEQKSQCMLGIHRIDVFMKDASFESKQAILASLSEKQPTEMLSRMRPFFQMKTEFRLKYKIGETPQHLPEDLVDKIFKHAYTKIGDVPYDIAKALVLLKGVEQHLLTSPKPRAMTLSSR